MYEWFILIIFRIEFGLCSYQEWLLWKSRKLSQYDINIVNSVDLVSGTEQKIKIWPGNILHNNQLAQLPHKNSLWEDLGGMQ